MSTELYAVYEMAQSMYTYYGFADRGYVPDGTWLLFAYVYNDRWCFVSLFHADGPGGLYMLAYWVDGYTHQMKLRAAGSAEGAYDELQAALAHLEMSAHRHNR